MPVESVKTNKVIEGVKAGKVNSNKTQDRKIFRVEYAKIHLIKFCF